MAKDKSADGKSAKDKSVAEKPAKATQDNDADPFLYVPDFVFDGIPGYPRDQQPGTMWSAASGVTSVPDGGTQLSGHPGNMPMPGYPGDMAMQGFQQPQMMGYSPQGFYPNPYPMYGAPTMPPYFHPAQAYWQGIPGAPTYGFDMYPGNGIHQAAAPPQAAVPPPAPAPPAHAEPLGNETSPPRPVQLGNITSRIGYKNDFAPEWCIVHVIINHRLVDIKKWGYEPRHPWNFIGLHVATNVLFKDLIGAIEGPKKWVLTEVLERPGGGSWSKGPAIKAEDDMAKKTIAAQGWDARRGVIHEPVWCVINSEEELKDEKAEKAAKKAAKEKAKKEKAGKEKAGKDKAKDGEKADKADKKSPKKSPGKSPKKSPPKTAKPEKAEKAEKSINIKVEKIRFAIA